MAVIASDSDSDGESVADGHLEPGSRDPPRKKKSTHAMATKDGGYAWTADYKRSWDAVQEDASGSITSAVTGIIEAGKRRRVLTDATPVQRGIIRHLVLILDFSVAMAERDLRPSRVALQLSLTVEFIHEFFGQNPIGQLAILGMSGGITKIISSLGGNPHDHVAALSSGMTCEGDASLQNALDMARTMLYHVPNHGTREVLLVFGGLVSRDSGNIKQTVASLVTEKISVRIIGLAAALAICKEIVKQTNPDQALGYGVILNEHHFKDLLMAVTTPPATGMQKSSNSLIIIGFPSRRVEQVASLCACHSKVTYDGYDCPRCSAQVCGLPTKCPTCALTLILSTHLARGYHHLFPLRNWDNVPWDEAPHSTACFACCTLFPQTDASKQGRRKKTDQSTASESGRYSCPACKQHFCIDCDLFAHEVMFECPGCQAGAGRSSSNQGKSLELPTLAPLNDVVRNGT